MEVVDRYLKPQEKQYEIDCCRTEGSGWCRMGRKVPPSPLRVLADGAKLYYDTLAKRLWAFRNNKLGSLKDRYGEKWRYTKNAGVASEWMPFDDADKLLCEMHVSWFSSDELQAAYESVNLVAVDEAFPCVGAA